MPLLRRAAGAVQDFVLPPQCLGCRGRIDTHPGLCSTCWSEMAFIAKPLCDRTGLPFPYDPGPGIVSARALAKPPVWSRARAATAFGPVSRDLIHALKYRDRLEAASLMARLMASAGSELLDDAKLIVPVPLYRTRLWRRRFNQSGELASRISKLTGVPVVHDLLHRRKPTRSQVGLSNKDRQRNVRNAFEVAPEHAAALGGRHVLLIDDVITTGATAGACAAALQNAGAVQVDVLAFAMVTGA